MNILITSAGRRVSLVREFQKELKFKYPDGKVFCADMNPFLSPACQIADGFFQVPSALDISYIKSIINICKANDIKIVIPTIDTELLPLSKHKEDFTKEGIICLISVPELIEICRDKRKTHLFFEQYSVNYAQEKNPYDSDFPIFVKPVAGSSSKNITVVKRKEEINLEHVNNPNFLFLEYLDPALHYEVTIDLYYNKLSELCCIVPRERIEIRSGEVSKAITRKNFLVDYMRDRFSYVKGFFGCITFQVFIHKMDFSVIGIEINPRFGGGYPLSYAAGANFPKWILDEYLGGVKVSIFDNWEDNLLMLRYDDEILIHGA